MHLSLILATIATLTQAKPVAFTDADIALMESENVSPNYNMTISPLEERQVNDGMFCPCYPNCKPKKCCPGTSCRCYSWASSLKLRAPCTKTNPPSYGCYSGYWGYCADNLGGGFVVC